jgi:putative solute:sodium symporter small subunit
MIHDPVPPTSANPVTKAGYWRRTRQLTIILLACWFLVTLGTIFFARELSAVSIFGWPISFYMAAQGSALVYLLIVGIYAWRMRKLEKTFTSDQPDAQ